MKDLVDQMKKELDPIDKLIILVVMKIINEGLKDLNDKLENKINKENEEK